MNPFEDEAYLSQQQSYLFEESKDPIHLADIKRKRLALAYAASTKLLDNVSACTLLKTNLNDYSEHVISNGIYDQRVKELLTKSKAVNNSFQWKSGIHNIDIASKIVPLECGEIVCASETVPHADFELFVNSFNQTSNKASDELSHQPNYNRNFNNRASVSKRFDNNPIVVEAVEVQAKPKFGGVFKTAKDELGFQFNKKIGNNNVNVVNPNPPKKKLGIRRGIANKFISPMLSSNNIDNGDECKSGEWGEEDESLKNIEPRMIELIKSEIMDNGTSVDWNDIAGLEFAKTAIQEAVVWPMLRPDIFTGLRRPPKGILLFGPPGTGKTLIGKCVASQSKSTFFSISASSLTSKWVGDGEKMVRALFAVARCYQPAVIFIDEIDSLLSQRSDQEHESSRRIKTEFLVQLDGATTDNDERLLVIGATNRPQELDEAARRRFVKRLYIPLPDLQARLQLVERLMTTETNALSKEHLENIAKLSDGYSGADMRNLCSDACLGPIRSIDMSRIQSIQATEVRPVSMDDFKKALTRVKSSVSPHDLNQYIIWNNTYGSGTF